MNNEQLTLIRFTDPFNKGDKEYITIPIAGKSLYEIRNDYINECFTRPVFQSLNNDNKLKFVTSINGSVIPDNILYRYYPKNGDWIVIMPKVGFGDDTFRGLAFLALAVIATIVTAGATSALMGMGWVTATGAASFGALALGGLAGLATLMVGGLLINALLPPVSPEEPSNIGGDWTNSQSYSWNPQTTQQQGVVIPRIYGLVQSYGNVISTYIETLNDKQYLNVLMGLSQGPVDRIYEGKINDQPLEQFNGVEFHTRLGRLSQAIVPNFNDTKTEYALAYKITYNTPYIYETIGSAFDALEIDVKFPRGIYHINDDSSMGYHSIDVRIEIRKHGTTDWTAITRSPSTYTITNFSGRWSKGFWTGWDPASMTWYEVESGGSTVYSDHYDGELAEEDWLGRDVMWRWFDSSTYSTVTSENTYETVTDARNESITKTFKCTIPSEEKGQYDIRVSRLSADIDSSRYGDDMYFSAVREVLEDDFTYPRLAMAGLKALATDQLSGSLKFSCMVKGLKVRVWDGIVWTVEWSDNPAWVCYDILTQPVIKDDDTIERYDGINASRIDHASFKTWADFCNVAQDDGFGGTEKRYTFNGTFDFEGNIWEAALKVCMLAQACLVWDGINIKAVVDTTITASQMFTVGNIIADSFKITYLPFQERVSEIETTFINKDKNYEKDTYSVLNANIDYPNNKTNIDLFGCTKFSQAYRTAMFRLLCNQHLTRTISFNADIDSIACEIGDRIEVQHSMPIWGYGGRLVSATTETVTLDQQVTIDGIKTYEIMIRTTDDVISTKTITTGACTTDTITLAVPFAVAPSKYDPYAFGETTVSTKPFKVTSISRPNNNVSTISAIEYVSDIYVDIVPNIPWKTGTAHVERQDYIGDSQPTQYGDVSNAMAKNMTTDTLYAATINDVTGLPQVYALGVSEWLLLTSYPEASPYAFDRDIALSFDLYDNLHVAFKLSNEGNSIVWGYMNDSGVWSEWENIGTSSGSGSKPMSLTCASDGDLYFIYNSGSALYFKKKPYGSSWEAPVKIKEGSGAGYPLLKRSVALGEYVHILYQDGATASDPIYHCFFKDASVCTETLINDMTTYTGPPWLMLSSTNESCVDLIGEHDGLGDWEIKRWTESTCTWTAVTEKTAVVGIPKFGTVLADNNGYIYTDTGDKIIKYNFELQSFSTAATGIDIGIYSYGDALHKVYPKTTDTYQIYLALWGVIEHDLSEVVIHMPYQDIAYSAIEKYIEVSGLTAVESVRLSESSSAIRDIRVGYTIEANPLYDHVEVWHKQASGDWRKDGDTVETFFHIRDALPNTLYTIKVVGVNNSGLKKPWNLAPTTTITTSTRIDYYNDQLLTGVTGLQIVGKSGGENFTGKDCQVTWNRITSVDNTYDAGEEPTEGAGFNLPPIWFQDYEVKILTTNDIVKRTTYVTTNEYTYLFVDNYDDNSGSPMRDFKVQVRARDRYGSTSLIPAQINTSNLAPTAPTNLTVTPGSKKLVIHYDAVSEADIEGYELHASTSDWYIPSSVTMIYKGNSLYYTYDCDALTTYTVKTAAYDAFGTGSYSEGVIATSEA